MQDDNKSLHYYLEAHRVLPGDMEILSWLGAYYVSNSMYEKAMPFFELAGGMEPSEVRVCPSCCSPARSQQAWRGYRPPFVPSVCRSSGS